MVNIKNIKLPKIKFKVHLSALLLVVFVLVILVELFFLYSNLYADVELRKTDLGNAQSAPDIDIQQYNAAAEWFDEREAYDLPSYTLQQGIYGLENPFAE